MWFCFLGSTAIYANNRWLRRPGPWLGAGAVTASGNLKVVTLLSRYTTVGTWRWRGNYSAFQLELSTLYCVDSDLRSMSSNWGWIQMISCYYLAQNRISFEFIPNNDSDRTKGSIQVAQTWRNWTPWSPSLAATTWKLVDEIYNVLMHQSWWCQWIFRLISVSASLARPVTASAPGHGPGHCNQRTGSRAWAALSGFFKLTQKLEKILCLPGPAAPAKSCPSVSESKFQTLMTGIMMLLVCKSLAQCQTRKARSGQPCSESLLPVCAAQQHSKSSKKDNS